MPRHTMTPADLAAWARRELELRQQEAPLDERTAKRLRGRRRTAARLSRTEIAVALEMVRQP